MRTNSSIGELLHRRLSQLGAGASIRHEARENQPFRELPKPTGDPPYRLSLEDALAAGGWPALPDPERIIFHVGGDTGGVKRPEVQQIVADHMEAQARQNDAPSFFYHLGDVAYYFGEADEYFPQFFHPYVKYPRPIFAIPGNHDGDLKPNDRGGRSLEAFVDTFCQPEVRISPLSSDAPRVTMTQPNVYWTLVAPCLTIVGLYTNVPEGGELDAGQKQWLRQELTEAPADRPLLVATHHPIYSLDDQHSGSEYMGEQLDSAIGDTGRLPDLVLSAHVHDYQRYTRPFQGREIPYIVAGASGYWHLHRLPKAPDGSSIAPPVRVPQQEIALENYVDDRHGFMRLTVTRTRITGEYFTVSRPQESWSKPPERVDAFALDLAQHRLVTPDL